MPDINRAYQWAINTCNAPNVGYSQNYRNQQTVNGITYYDCSSFINYALLAGGWVTPDYAPNNNPIYTSVLCNVLLSLGFTEVSPTGEYRAGDIGWRQGHTEMCYKGGNGKGVFMGAHTDEVALPNQVSISNFETSFTRLFRYGEGATGGYGSSIYVVSAICGNAWQESTLSPSIWENLKPATPTTLKHGYGLFGWTNTGGNTHGRMYQLFQWLRENGYSDDDGDGQLQYLVHENVWYPTAEYPFNTLEDFLKSDSTDIEMLTHAFNKCWEGIHDVSWDNRVDYARQCYNYILKHGNDSSINTWYKGNRYLSVPERLNNAVLFWRFFSAGGGGGGQPTQKKKKMPLWMYLRRY